jgi:hypothetical protein
MTAEATMTRGAVSDLFSGIISRGYPLMPWARIDDAFDDHPKVLALLEHEQGGAAVGLWTLCLTWAYRNTLRKGKTPGLLPASLPRRYLGPGARELASLLVKEELWEALDEGDGWLIHDFSEYLATDKTRAARSEAGSKGAAARWGKSAGRDSNLPSGDGKAVAPDGSGMAEGANPAASADASPGSAQTDGNLPSSDSNLPSGLPSDDGKPLASDGSRAPARRAIPNGIAPVPVPDPVPPTAGADAAGPNPGPVVAAFIEGATGAGLKRPGANLIARVGKQARLILGAGVYTADEVITAARTMGAGEWNDLEVQLRKDDAARNGRAQRVGGESTGTQRARAATEAGRRVQQMIDEGKLP